MWDAVSDVLVGGVNFTSVSLGGEECRDHVTSEKRTLITAIGLVLTCVFFWLGKDCLEQTNPNGDKLALAGPSSARTKLSILLALVFGVQLGFKLATRTLIYVLYPCQVVTVVWIWLLASRVPNAVAFRTVINLTHGAALGLLLPVTDGLYLPGEIPLYWIQHSLIFFVPFYCVIFESEAFFLPPKALPWPNICLTFGAWQFHHFVLMQSASVLSLVNIGHMLCPADSDPFADLPPSYILIGVVHQLLACIVSALFASAARKLSFIVGKNEDKVLHSSNCQNGTKKVA